MLNVTVKRSRWLRGGKGDSALLSPTSKRMCCLGFASREAGLKACEIRDQATPYHINQILPKSLKKLLGSNSGDSYGNSNICWKLMQTNDNELLKDPEREKRLKKFGLKVGIRFRFVD